MLGTAIASATTAVAMALPLTTAIITSDSAVLRAAPREAALQQAVLRQGEMVEVRGERLDYLQVYDHGRERAGFVRASQVRRTALAPHEAPELLTVLRFVKDTPGQEALAIGLAAAWLKAAPAKKVQGQSGIEALDALGTVADRLAARASLATPSTSGTQSAVAAQLEVAARYGVRFASYESDGRMQVCYEGEAFRRVLAMASSPEQRARAALALTRLECADPALRPTERAQLDQWRAEVLERVEVNTLPGFVKNRMLMRRASVWSGLAYQRTRAATPDAGAAAERSLADLASVSRTELPDEDQAAYNDAAMRVNASRWAAASASMGTSANTTSTKAPHIVTTAGQPGETCVQLIDGQSRAANPLAQRCTYGLVWAQSATANREGNALALAVQPMQTWRELWLFRKVGNEWTISVLPPASTTPDTGYAEFAGWVPGGKQMLIAREARGEGKYQRSFALANIDTLNAERQSSDPASLGAFQRWQDPAWKRNSVSVR